MFAQNIAHQAVIDGHTVLFISAGQLLGDPCARRLMDPKKYAHVRQELGIDHGSEDDAARD